MATSLSDSTWLQASTLPIDLGGLGLRDSRRTAAAAFLGSCSAVQSVSARLLKPMMSQAISDFFSKMLSFVRFKDSPMLKTMSA